MNRLLMLWTGFFVLSLLCVSTVQAEHYRIGILLWHDVKHDRVAVEGFMEGIEFSEIHHSFDLKIAHEDKKKSRAILRQWKWEGIDLVLAVGTVSALLAMEELKQIPIVFTAVTNPVTSGIARQWEKPGNNITGSSNWVRSEYKLKLFSELLPSLRKLGVIYNAQNPVPVAEVSDAEKIAQTLGITIIRANYSCQEEVATAVENLLEQGIDALWAPIETCLYKNLDHVGRISIDHKLPVFSSTPTGVDVTPAGKSVAMLGVTVNYRMLGRRSAHTAIEILTQGTNPGDIPVQTLQPIVIINVFAAEAIDFAIPASFMARSDHIIYGFGGQKIIVEGTGDNQQLMRKLARALEKKIRGVEIEIPDSVGSTGGVKALAAGRVNLARIARPLRGSEKENGLTARLFAYSPIVFAVNPSVSRLNGLNSEQIIKIYSGHIDNWLEVGDSRNRIYAISREPGDSSLQILKNKLQGFKGINTQATKTIYSTPEAVRALIDHRYTIAYAALTAIQDTNLRVMKVDGIYPSPENVNNGRYKLVTPFSIVYREEPSGLTRAFVDFIYSEEGQKIIAGFGAIPVDY